MHPFIVYPAPFPLVKSHNADPKSIDLNDMGISTALLPFLSITADFASRAPAILTSPSHTSYSNEFSPKSKSFLLSMLE